MGDSAMGRFRAGSREITVPCYATPSMEPAPHKYQRKTDLLAVARDAMETEARAILSASRRLNNSVVIAADLILSATGKLGHAKVIFTGIGKSGHIARKVAATFQSTGTPAVFLHPSEEEHGDIGIWQPGDPVVM